MSGKALCPFASSFQSSSSPPSENRGGELLQNRCPFGFGSSATPTSSTAGNRDNSATLTCPLGFGSGNRSSRNKSLSLLAFDRLPRIPLDVLAGHSSSEVRLVSIKGVVFDVSRDEAFQSQDGATGTGTGGSLAHLAGHDASRYLATFHINDVKTREAATSATVDAVDGSRQKGVNCGGIGGSGFDVGLEGLSYEEHWRLESHFVRMVEMFRAVAVLEDDDHTRCQSAWMNCCRKSVLCSFRLLLSS